MFALELSEMVEIFVVGIVGAIPNYFGMVYCSNPFTTSIVGVFGQTIWYFEGQISVVLAFNRLLIMYDGNYAKRIFDGYKVIVYIIVAILSAICMIVVGPPFVYSGVGGGFFSDPHVGYLPPDPYLFFQISIICFLTIISCLGYAYEIFFDHYKVLVIITTDAYILYLGSPAFVYLLLNKSIRHEVTELLKRLLKSRDVVSFDANANSANMKTTRQEFHS
ncbi:serpentine type 7TM GPCR chemoreceptor srt domain-containing protein [Ditylenchus destructor]|nr:serpentine type 7TM GPCR chemoreceptor srt domain-containing protein [Ditylenchus destructor]